MTFWISLGAYSQIDSLSVEHQKDSIQTLNFEKKKGQLALPADHYISIKNCCVDQYNQYVSKRIISTGSPSENILKVTCDASTQAIAVAEGRVVTILILADSYTVILKHGQYRTSYSNLESVKVSTGQDVKEKQALGTIKTTNLKTILDFELWFNSSKINSMDWFSL